MTIDKKKLRLYLDNNLNVLLIGRHGTGKTTVCTEVFNEAGINWKYFSGSTLDPWVDFCGVPYEKEGRLTLLRPNDFDEDKVEAIMIDEYNRSHSKIRNAVMELIQFKSINGRKFKNLRVVWAAINPDDDEELTYDVEKLDPAQEDRFPIHIQVPYNVSKEFFSSKYGENGIKACEWWDSLSDENKNLVSPRRLDYAVDIWLKNGDVRDVLPKGVNATQLISVLSSKSTASILKEFMKNGDESAARTWINIDNNYSIAVEMVLKNNNFKDFFLPLLNKERLSTLISTRYDVLKWAAYNYNINSDVESTVNYLISTGDKKLRQKLHEEISNTTPSPSTLNYGTIIGIDIIENPNIPQKSTYKGKELHKATTLERSDAISELYMEPPIINSSEDAHNLLEDLNHFCMKSHLKTVALQKKQVMSLFNSAMSYILLNSHGLSHKYIHIFNLYPYLYKRIYNNNLLKHCTK